MAITSFPPSRSRTSVKGRLSLLDRARLAGSTHRQRQALRRLDDAALADIGISRTDAIRESKRSLWDAPKTWQR